MTVLGGRDTVASSPGIDSCRTRIVSASFLLAVGNRGRWERSGRTETHKQIEQTVLRELSVQNLALIEDAACCARKRLLRLDRGNRRRQKPASDRPGTGAGR